MKKPESPDSEVLYSALAWLGAGKEVTLVTVAQTWGSSPRPLGSLAAITRCGQIAGSVSGGCVEDDLIAKIQSNGKTITTPETVSYGVTADQAGSFGLPCGGRLLLILEKLTDAEVIENILIRIENRQQIIRRLCLKTGKTTLLPAPPAAQRLRYSGWKIEKLFGPEWRLLVIGANQLSRYVAQIALTLDYEVIVCDPREKYLSSWQTAGVQLDSRMPDDAVAALADDQYSIVITLTHDPKLDDMALMTALDSRAFYVGALGSRQTNEQRRERLATLGVSKAGIARLHGPVGLPIGSRSPAEIAVAIMAELVACQQGVRLSANGSPP